MHETLEAIRKDYQSGGRERTVISNALLDNKPIPPNELFEQFAVDLEDQDIHPDSITLNEGFIQNWILEVTQYSTDRREVTTQSDEQSDKNQGSSGHKQAAIIPRQGAGTTVSAAHSERSHTYHTALVEPEEGLALSIADQRNLSESRPGSVSSHRSKPEEWRAFDHPNPEFVYDMLCPFFKSDPYNLPTPEQTRHRIMRAFHQQDWSSRGYLTRSETIKLCVELLKRSNIQQDDDSVIQMVRVFDANGDGQIDKHEFCDMLNGFIKTTADLRSQHLQKKLQTLGNLTEGECETSRLTLAKSILPWGVEQRRDNNNQWVYIDKITEHETIHPPNLPLEHCVFSAMTLHADNCVGIIGSFRDEWLGIVPKAQQAHFRAVLDRVSSAALKFVRFENRDSSGNLKLSDYDLLSLCQQVKLSWAIRQGNSGIEPSARAREFTTFSNTAAKLLRSIVGFCHLLASFASEKIEAIQQNFPRFRHRWIGEQLDFCAQQISLNQNELDVAEALILPIEAHEIADQEGATIVIVQDYVAYKEARRSALEALPFKGVFHSINYNNNFPTSPKYRSIKIFNKGKSKWKQSFPDSADVLDAKRISLRITVKNPHQVFNLPPVKFEASGFWVETATDM